MWVDRRAAAIEEILGQGRIKGVEWFDEIDSTNSVARRELAARAALPGKDRLLLPKLIVADRQTAGRGRSLRQWWSPDGCLMLTLAIDASWLPPDSAHWSQLALISGMAVANSAAQFVDPAQVQLKWPNDVYVSGRKLAGVLIESAAVGPSLLTSEAEKPGRVASWLIGIGLNVAMDWRAAPPDLARKATCLSTVAGGVDIDRCVVLVELATELSQCILDWRDGHLDWLEHWRQRCLLTSRIVHARMGAEEELIGLCEGIDSLGRLIVRDENRQQFLTTAEIVNWQ